MASASIPFGERKQILSLQALRAVAFLGIFLEHVNSPVRWPAIGVSVFFVLSGFLMEYRYAGKDLSCSIPENLRFSARKISKLYPLHILTMCLAVIRELAVFLSEGTLAQNVRLLLCNIGLNTVLLQAWVRRIGICASLNGVAWFLSAMVFLYFTFPYICRWIEAKRNSTLLTVCSLGLLLQAALTVAAMKYLGRSNNTYNWFTYFFPLYRLGEFGIGACLGKFYLSRLSRRDDAPQGISAAWSVAEILLTAITVLLYGWAGTSVDSPILGALHNNTLPYILPAVGWVYLFVRKQGIITNLLCNQVLIALGNLSPDMFLIHAIVTSYTEWILSGVGAAFSGLWAFPLIVLQFAVTLALTVLYQKLRKKFRAIPKSTASPK